MSQFEVQPPLSSGAVRPAVGSSVCSAVGDSRYAFRAAIGRSLGATISTAVRATISTAVLDPGNAFCAAVGRTFKIRDTFAG